MYSITKSLFVGAAVCVVSNTGKADIVISDAVRSKLEVTIEDHLRGLYQRINGEFPDSLDDKSLTEDRDKIMMSLLDNIDGLPWGVPTFYSDLCANIRDFNRTKGGSYLTERRDYLGNPVTFTQEYFEENFTPRKRPCGTEGPTVDLNLTRVLDRLYDVALCSDDEEKIEKGLKAGIIEENEEARLGMRRVYRKKPHVVFSETFIQQLLDLYVPEAVKNSPPLIGFHYSMYLFFDKKIPLGMDSFMYFLAKRVFEVARRCNYLERRFGLDSEETFEGFKRLKEMFPRFARILNGIDRGGVCQADSKFPDGFRGLSFEWQEALKRIKEEHEAFIHCLSQKAQALEGKIDDFLTKK